VRVIDVRLYAHLPAASKRGVADFQLEARPGLTVGDVVDEAGVPAKDVFFILIDGVRGQFDSVLSDNQHVALFPAVSGG
jgi:molybdopterin converting factor small subunit